MGTGVIRLEQEKIKGERAVSSSGALKQKFAIDCAGGPIDGVCLAGECASRESADLGWGSSPVVWLWTCQPPNLSPHL